jgi:hypothetical protein
MTTIRECMKGRAKLVNLYGIGCYTLAVVPFFSAPRAHVPLASLRWLGFFGQLDKWMVCSI